MTKNSRPRSRRHLSIPLAVQPSGVPFWAENDGGLSEGSQSPLLDPTEEELLSAKPHPDSFRAVVAPLLVAGHLIGILPASAATSSVPSFRWTSVSVLFSMAVMVAVFLRIVVYGYVIYKGYMTAFDSIVSSESMLIFNVIATLQFLLYIRLAKRWRMFVLCFLRIEHRLGDEGLPPKLRPKMLFMTVFILILSTFEAVLQVISIPLSKSPSDRNSVVEIIEDHYYSAYNHVAYALSFSFSSWIYAEFTSLASHIILNYNDVFLIMVSICILRRFRLLREQVFKHDIRTQGFWYWKQQRETFNDLSKLTRDIDHYISVHFLLSCLNNVLSICIELQHTVSLAPKSQQWPRKLYFVLSFVSVIFRSGAVVYSASAIPEECKAIKRALYSVPSFLYSEEIERFIHQVTTDEISFTGLGLFTITRSFVLTMLGTMATYEIILVQTYKEV